MNIEPTGLDRIIQRLRTRDDVEGAAQLEIAEEVQREIDQIHRTTAAAAARDGEARLAHCLTLAAHLRAIVGRFASKGVMDPGALLRDDPQDRVLELARVQAVAEALESLAQETAPCGH